MSIDLERFAFSFSHAIIKVDDRQFTGVSSIEFSQDVDRSAVYGTSRKPLKRSPGQLQLGDGTITFSDLEESGQFFEALGSNPTAKVFNVDVTFSNEQGDIRSFECVSCALKGFSASFEAGADALGLDVPFDFLGLKIDGVEFAT